MRKLHPNVTPPVVFIIISHNHAPLLCTILLNTQSTLVLLQCGGDWSEVTTCSIQSCSCVVVLTVLKYAG